MVNVQQYETVFIINPALSEEQTKETVEKFRKYLTDNGSTLIHEDNIGLKPLAYPIQKKNSGYYYLIEFTAPTTLIKTLAIEYTREDKIMRQLTTALDKHSVAYNEKRRQGLIGKKRNEEAK